MGGILKNKDESSTSPIHLSDSTKEFREQVLKNTKLNAQLKETHNESINPSDPRPIINVSEEERLKWNAQNLSENEIIQKNIMENLTETIDEPKTPFQHASLPELNEYYRDDDDEGELEDFSLGEPEFKVDELDKLENKKSGLQSEVQVGEGEEGEEGEEEEEEEEEEPRPKKSFAELRKEHYHHEHPPAPLEKLIDEEEDEIDEEEEDEEPKQKMSFAELRKHHYKNEHGPR